MYKRQVNTADLKEAIENGIITEYITDFPDADVIALDNVICIPHLGASTPESEENCAEMAAIELKQYIEYGNIKNSVNFPACSICLLYTSYVIIKISGK